MDFKKAKKILEMIEQEDKIKNNIVKGLNILSKYDDDMEFAAGNEKIYVCNFEKTVEKMTEKDVEMMGYYGFFEDEDSWSFWSN